MVPGKGGVWAGAAGLVVSESQSRVPCSDNQVVGLSVLQVVPVSSDQGDGQHSQVTSGGPHLPAGQRGFSSMRTKQPGPTW